VNRHLPQPDLNFATKIARAGELVRRIRNGEDAAGKALYDIVSPGMRCYMARHLARRNVEPSVKKCFETFVHKLRQDSQVSGTLQLVRIMKEFISNCDSESYIHGTPDPEGVERAKAVLTGLADADKALAIDIFLGTPSSRPFRGNAYLNGDDTSTFLEHLRHSFRACPSGKPAWAWSNWGFRRSRTMNPG
jgi:hypothetical protein